ncbi:hypothetical protein [Spirosoma foliorum]|uniref:Uncharacterized protein n=1 Tax=Spirosoma foliorum TaxID=2710596 RepID=A0A7G5H2F5_9BACT|nr:hypothetical protein [Spirosoma foliorum]QMW05297.1 hypothetical protein H3H32_10630 [Spirosoma foliorum]
MSKGYHSDGSPLTPPTKQKTKAKKKGPYNFSQDIVTILESDSIKNATAHIEHCLRQYETYTNGGKSAHAAYLYSRIQALQAKDQYATLEPEESQELDWLNKTYADLENTPMKP